MDKTENQLKYENYKEQFTRLKSALNSGFNLEAMFIEYAIMEDRTESILRHADKWEAYLKKRGRNEPTLNSKIVYIQKLMESNRKDLLHRYFSDDLLDCILAWKEDRNRLIHSLLKQQLEHNEVKTLAEQGKRLVDELRNQTGNYTRTVERRKAKNVS
jgi:hypothetical protein